MAGGDGVPDEQRQSVESAVSEMTAGAPPDWVSLHAEFALTKATATVNTESEAEPVALTVPPEALQQIAVHQQKAVESGDPWQRLIVDCDRTGELSVRAVPVRARRLNERVWSVSARSSLLVIPLVVGVLLFAMWLLEKWFVTQSGERATLLFATAIAVAISLVVGGALFSSESSTTRGIGLSLMASAAVVLIGGVGFAFWLF